MNIEQILALEFNRNQKTIENILNLFGEGATIPFIARYRKEVTGNMEDVELRQFEERYNQLVAFKERRETIEKSIKDQDKWTDEIETALDEAQTMAELEDIYRPYKPKRRTRATMAIEKGLKPLAMDFLNPEISLNELESNYEGHITEELSLEEVIQGMKDIVAEVYQDDAKIRDILKKFLRRNAVIATTQGKNDDDTYKMYFDREEKYSRIPNHRVLAIDRGEKEEALSVKLVAPEETLISIMLQTVGQKNDKSELEREIAEDALKRLIYPSLDRELRGELTERAQEEAIDVFGRNLKPLLLTPPLRQKRVLALDPGYRTGAKVAVLDEYGNFLDKTVVYPAMSEAQVKKSKDTLEALIKDHDIDVIAIGSGTASYETEKVVSDLIAERGLDIEYAIVNEDGASVYSASKLAKEEFPNLDVTIRGAISIGRRLQDPLAELVKIEPRNIGVGQYQHDLNKKALDTRLEGVVEDCVNHVGVDVNTASAVLLSHVAGISKSVAGNIVERRQNEGPFLTREEIRDVKGIGPKTFEQAAGFLRIPGGKEILDNTGVHPESYEVARILQDKTLSEEQRQERINELEVGAYTLEDIKRELERPGRDPREDLEGARLRRAARSFEDLEIGEILKGTVRNVVDFGAFVDIGVGTDGLVHISKMTKKRGKKPYELVEVGDILEVEIIDLDQERKRISLSLKELV